MIGDFFHLELCGKSLEETVAIALEKWKCTRAEIDMEIVEVPRRGFLGFFGGRPARVVCRLIDRGTLAARITEHLLALCGMPAEVEVQAGSSRIDLSVKSPEPNQVIGPRGQNLEALQSLVVSLTDRYAPGDRIPIAVDVDNYRGRRRSEMHRLARKLCRQVRLGGESVTVPLGYGEESRNFKSALKEEIGIEFRALGRGKERKLVIFPKKG